MNWRCRLGFHKWHQNKPFTPDFVFPIGGSDWKRFCSKCGRREWWLPGYGGSEIGCWLKEAE